MALRFGYQVSCNLKANAIFRPVSPNLSRSKSASPVGRRKFTSVSNSDLKQISNNPSRSATIPTRRESSSKKSFIKLNYSSADRISKNISSDLTNKPVTHLSAVNEKYPERRELQPRNLLPIASKFIHNNTSILPSLLCSLNVETLQRSAIQKYENAIKTLRATSRIEDDRKVRYQLKDAESTPRKTINEPQLRSWYKKKYHTKEDIENTPSLQPKHIKPYCAMRITQWNDPNIRNAKHRHLALQAKQKTQKYNHSDKVERQNVTQTARQYVQRRKYSTVDNIFSTEIAPLIGSIKECTEDHVNLDLTTKEDTKKRKKHIASITQVHDQKSTNFVEPVKSIKRLCLAQNKTKLTPISFQTKTSFPLSRKGSVLLYYRERNGKKTLCSKIIRTEEGETQSLHSTNSKELNPIKIRTGPKLMLQSMKYTNECPRERLTPEPNEKFIVPWLSWSDCVKQMKTQTRSSEDAKHCIEIPSNSQRDAKVVPSLCTALTSFVT